MNSSDVYISVTDGENFNREFLSACERRFVLRETASEVLQGVGVLSRMANCGNREGRSSLEIFVPENANPFFGGFFCESSSCPYCASKKGAKRLHDLEDGIISFQTLFPGGMVAMLVLTFSHCVTDTLKDIGERFREAKKEFFKFKTVQRVFDSLGCIGRVSAPETTWSASNGFHPHEHILFFLTNVTPETLRECRTRLFPYWESACKKFGLSSAPERFYFEFGYTSNLKDYITKCAREVTLSDCKKAIKQDGMCHYSPFQLLTAYHQNAQTIFADKFREYALYAKGLKSHNWSRGLASQLGVKQKAEFMTKEEEKAIAERGFRIIFSSEINKFSVDARLYLLRLLSCTSDSIDKKLVRFLNGTRESNFDSIVESFVFCGKKDKDGNDIIYPGAAMYEISNMESESK